MTTPAFDDLPVHDGVGLRHAWDVLDHDLGTLARLTPEHIADAATLVQDGVVFALSLPVDIPGPPLFGRDPVRHEVFALDRNNVDERLDAFYPQASSQWDGLRHVRAREHGFFGGWNGNLDGAGPLGMEHWARRGIVGRGVLLDIVRLRLAQGRDYDPHGGEDITADDLEEAAATQNVALRPGDILCVRTGWVDSYRCLDAERRVDLGRRPPATGLRADEATARWLWDHGVAALGLDNPAVEVIPGDPKVGSLHRRLIPMLGFALAELLDLDALADACSEDGRRDFMFVAAPMHLPGGVGSPANAVAIR